MQEKLFVCCYMCKIFIIACYFISNVKFAKNLKQSKLVVK